MKKRLPHAIEQLRGSYRLPKSDLRTLRVDLAKVQRRNHVAGLKASVNRGVLHFRMTDRLQIVHTACRWINRLENEPLWQEFMQKTNAELAS